MSQFYESLKRFVTPAMISKAAGVVDEKEANISTAVSSIFASLLGIMGKKGNSHLKNILDEGGNLNILKSVELLCEENPSENQRKLGDDFLQNILGDKAADFSNSIAKYAGISKVAVNRLVSMLAPIVVGYFGKKVAVDGWSMQKIQHEIQNQKNSFIGLIPDDLARSFGISKVATNGSEPQKPAKKNGWITWAIIVLLLLLALFLWRSCRSGNSTINTQSMVIDTIRQAPSNVSTASYTDDTQSANVGTATRAVTAVTLPNGTVLNIYRDGTEEMMLKYLNSDEYKKATDKDLQNRWFEFDNISFELGSGSKLKSGSNQLENIISILKNHKDAKIAIAGFADRTGGEEINMELSQERAQTIEKIFDDAGVGSQVVKAKGFGDEYAKYKASAPESDRAKDRDIALRLVK